MSETKTGQQPLNVNSPNGTDPGQFYDSNNRRTDSAFSYDSVGNL